MDTLCWFQVSILVFHRYYMYYSLLCIVFGAGVKKDLELNKTSWYIVCRHETKNRIRKVIVNIFDHTDYPDCTVWSLLPDKTHSSQAKSGLACCRPSLSGDNGWKMQVGEEQNQWRAGSQREKKRILKTMLFLNQTPLVDCLLFDHSHWLRACNRLSEDLSTFEVWFKYEHIHVKPSSRQTDW